jgi:hypothetical protein
VTQKALWHDSESRLSPDIITSVMRRFLFIAGCFLVGAFSFIPAAYAADSNELGYRYIKWDITDKKAVEDCSGAACVQASEFDLTRFGKAVAWPEGTVVTNPGGMNPEGEGPSNLIDGDTSTKWLDRNFNVDETQTTGHAVIVIDAGESLSFDGYQWATANDELGRDPVSWKLYGSNDGETWTLIDEVTNEEVTDTRYTYTGFSIYGAFFTGAFGDVTKTSATLAGDLHPEKAPLREIGFLYDTDPQFSNPSQVVVETDAFEDTSYSAAVTGLSCGTRYFYTAYLVAEDGMTISSDNIPSFITADCTDPADEPLHDEWYEAVRHTALNESWTGVAVSSDGQIMAATFAGNGENGGFGTIYVSTDGGTTWESRLTVSGLLLVSVAMSADGQHMIAVGVSGFGTTENLGVLSVYGSDDGGATWEERSQIDGTDFTEFLEDNNIADLSLILNFFLMSKVSVSDDSSVIYVSFFDKLYRSVDGGQTWETAFTSEYPGLVASSVDVSGDGQKAAFTLIFLDQSSDEYPSLVLSTTQNQWVPIYSVQDANLFSVDLSSNGRRIFAIDHLGQLHVSFDEGVNWHTSANPDGYAWVSAVPSATGNGVFAAALSGLTDEEGSSTLLALYYSADGGSVWEKMDEIDVTDRSGFLSLGSFLGSRISAADDLSRVALTSLFDLYVVTRGKVVAPPPDSPSHKIRYARRTKTNTVPKAPQTVEGLIAHYHDILLEAYRLGITLPKELLDLLGLPSPIPPVQDLTPGMEGENVRALQQLLIAQGYSISAGVTGFFGAQTQAALAKYQAEHNIAPSSGYFGPLTQAQMKTAGFAGLWW